MSIEPSDALTLKKKWPQAIKTQQAYSRRSALFTPKLQVAGAKYAIQTGDVDYAEGTNYEERSHEKFAMPAQPGETRKIGLRAPDAYDWQKGDLLGFIPYEEDAPLQLWRVISTKNYKWNPGLFVDISFVGLVER